MVKVFSRSVNSSFGSIRCLRDCARRLTPRKTPLTAYFRVSRVVTGCGLRTEAPRVTKIFINLIKTRHECPRGQRLATGRLITEKTNFACHTSASPPNSYRIATSGAVDRLQPLWGRGANIRPRPLDSRRRADHDAGRAEGGNRALLRRQARRSARQWKHSIAGRVSYFGGALGAAAGPSAFHLTAGYCGPGIPPASRRSLNESAFLSTWQVLSRPSGNVKFGGTANGGL